jgi:type I restriction enzyme S subunit
MIKKNKIFPAGTVIFPKRGGAIFTNKKRMTLTPICCDLNIMGVSSKGYLLSKFIFYYFININLNEIGSGSTIPQINNYHFEPFSIPVPPPDEQQRIAAHLDELSEHCKKLEAVYTQKLSLYDELKQSLLQKAFSGQL